METLKEHPESKHLNDPKKHAIPSQPTGKTPEIKERPRSVAILGLNRLQNNLLAQLFDSEIDIDVVVIPETRGLEQALDEAAQHDQQLLVLVDYRGTSPKETFETLQNQAQKSTWFEIALFNVPEETNLEDFAPWPQLSGAFLCSIDQDQLIKGVRAMLDGEIWLPRKLISKYVHRARAYYKPIDGSMEKLTEREIEILKVMSSGARNTEIAESLSLSPHTVKTHVYNIFKKINASNRLQAVNWANEHIPH